MITLLKIQAQQAIYAKTLHKSINKHKIFNKKNHILNNTKIKIHANTYTHTTDNATTQKYSNTE